MTPEARPPRTSPPPQTLGRRGPELNIRLRVRFEPRDLWVGVCWDRARMSWARAQEQGGARGFMWRTTVYVCVVPMLPIVVSWDREER